MNKKLLFAAMSLVAFTACTDNDFESQKVAEEVGSVQFEVLNNNDAFTRAAMNGNTISWSAATGDLFTLYHGAEVGALDGFQNATYKATETAAGSAILSTPSMILEGEAVMVWPVDSIFRITSDKALTIKIPAEQDKVVDIIPYVSDRMTIGEYTGKNYNDNTAGLDRKYTVYMRPLASQLNLKADYVGMDKLDALANDATDPIDPIEVTSVDLFTAEGSEFTTEIPVKWSDANNAVWNTNAATKTLNQTWSAVTDVNIEEIADDGKVVQLTAKDVTDDNTGCTFVILPQANIDIENVAEAEAANAAGAAVVVETSYGKVAVAPTGIQDSRYTNAELANAWYRFLPATRPANTPDGQWKQEYETRDANVKNAANYEKVYTTIANGMAQTINAFNAQTAPATSKVAGERMGAATTRYVKVLLKYLDMSDLHIKSDKQLRNAARVWKELDLASVTVYLDGDGTNHGFVMSQQTIAKINEINAVVGPNRKFTVKPCNEEGEVCDEIVITGGGVIPNLDFIVANVPEEQGEEPIIIEPVEPQPLPAAAKKADVVLQTGFTWTWDGTIKVATAEETGISSIINRGTMQNAQTKTLLIEDIAAEPQAVDIPVIIDRPGKWNITAGTINVQNRVTNNGTVTISSGAQYRQDGGKLGENSIFINEADTKEARFLGADEVQHIGKVVNYGVFAAVGDAIINNYSLIEHKADDAKTYITHNQTEGASFAEGFNAENNKMGRINLEYTNKDEDNISISAVDNPANMEGFVSVTVTGDNNNKVTLSNTSVGQFVNYIIINSGISEITNLSDQIKYVEINQSGTEIEWNLDPATPKIAQYDGLIVLSDVNIKLGTTITAAVTYLNEAAEMYVGGVFNKTALTQALDGVDADITDWDGYYGATSANVATNYVTFK